MFIDKISATKSDCIDQCLLRYAYKYIEYFPGFASKNEESLNFGSFIHKVFELGYLLKDTKSLMKIAEQERATYHIPFQYDDKIKICVENFIQLNSGLGETIATEGKFEVVLDVEAGIKHTGVIDRIVKGSDGGYLVIDYKSSKREKSKKDLLQDKQSMGYAYAVHKMHNIEFNKIWCGHYYPVSNHLVVVQFNKAQIFAWKKKEIDKVWRIRKKKRDEFPPMRNIFCDYCDMKPVCPLFNSEKEVCERLEEQRALAAEKKKLREQSKVEDGKDKNQ